MKLHHLIRLSSICGIALGFVSVIPVRKVIASPSAAASCYAQAVGTGFISRADKDRAAYLCAGAGSTAPADCYSQVIGTGFISEADKDRAAYLCATAQTVIPAKCYSETVGTGFISQADKDRAAYLCQTPQPRYIWHYHAR